MENQTEDLSKKIHSIEEEVVQIEDDFYCPIDCSNMFELLSKEMDERRADNKGGKSPRGKQASETKVRLDTSIKPTTSHNNKNSETITTRRRTKRSNDSDSGVEILATDSNEELLGKQCSMHLTLLRHELNHPCNPISTRAQLDQFESRTYGYLVNEKIEERAASLRFLAEICRRVRHAMDHIAVTKSRLYGDVIQPIERGNATQKAEKECKQKQQNDAHGCQAMEIPTRYNNSADIIDPDSVALSECVINDSIDKTDSNDYSSLDALGISENVDSEPIQRPSTYVVYKSISERVIDAYKSIERRLNNFTSDGYSSKKLQKRRKKVNRITKKSKLSKYFPVYELVAELLKDFTRICRLSRDWVDTKVQESAKKYQSVPYSEVECQKQLTSVGIPNETQRQIKSNQDTTKLNSKPQTIYLIRSIKNKEISPGINESKGHNDIDKECQDGVVNVSSSSTSLSLKAEVLPKSTQLSLKAEVQPNSTSLPPKGEQLSRQTNDEMNEKLHNISRSESVESLTLSTGTFTIRSARLSPEVDGKNSNEIKSSSQQKNDEKVHRTNNNSNKTESTVKVKNSPNSTDRASKTYDEGSITSNEKNKVSTSTGWQEAHMINVATKTSSHENKKQNTSEHPSRIFEKRGNKTDDENDEKSRHSVHSSPNANRYKLQRDSSTEKSDHSSNNNDAINFTSRTHDNNQKNQFQSPTTARRNLTLLTQNVRRAQAAWRNNERHLKRVEEELERLEREAEQYREVKLCKVTERAHKCGLVEFIEVGMTQMTKNRNRNGGTNMQLKKSRLEREIGMIDEDLAELNQLLADLEQETRIKADEKIVAGDRVKELHEKHIALSNELKKLKPPENNANHSPSRVDFDSDSSPRDENRNKEQLDTLTEDEAYEYTNSRLSKVYESRQSHLKYSAQIPPINKTGNSGKRSDADVSNKSDNEQKPLMKVLKYSQSFPADEADEKSPNQTEKSSGVRSLNDQKVIREVQEDARDQQNKSRSNSKSRQSQENQSIKQNNPDSSENKKQRRRPKSPEEPVPVKSKEPTQKSERNRASRVAWSTPQHQRRKETNQSNELLQDDVANRKERKIKIKLSESLQKKIYDKIAERKEKFNSTM